MISFACGLSANSKSTTSPSKPAWIKFSKKIIFDTASKGLFKCKQGIGYFHQPLILWFCCLQVILLVSKDFFILSCCFIGTVLLCRPLWGIWHLEVCLNICCWGTMRLPVKLVKWGKWHNSIIHRLRHKLVTLKQHLHCLQVGGILENSILASCHFYFVWSSAICANKPLNRNINLSYRKNADNIMQENQMKVIKSSESSEFYSILRLW